MYAILAPLYDSFCGLFPCLLVCAVLGHLTSGLVFELFLTKSVFPLSSVTVCPCLLWFLSLSWKTFVVCWRTYEVKTFICVFIHPKYVIAEWKPEMKGLINKIFYSYSRKKKLHLFIPWLSFSFQLPFIKGSLMSSLDSSRSSVKNRTRQNTFNFGHVFPIVLSVC